MSLLARQHLVANLVFQKGPGSTQASDLLDPNLTQTGLVALLLELVGKGHIIEVTAVRSDHSDDSGLGLHCHANGYCIDCWPLKSRRPGDYADADDTYMQYFLEDAAKSTWLYQIGLAGSAYTPENLEVAGPTTFQDDGADHIHLGAE